MKKKEKKEVTYWKATLKLLMKILIVWALVSFVASILLVDILNQVYLGGYPLGFWFSQQGSIYIFIALIFIYTKFMGKIDEKYDVHEQ
jgi:putative solute:sodium symporter small subunit